MESCRAEGRSLCYALAVLGGIGPAACSPIPPARGLVEDPGERVKGIETSLSVNPPTLSPGGKVELVFTITNVGDATLRLRFPLTHQIGLVVLEPGGEVYSTDDETIAIPRHLVLGPFESWEHRVGWDGRVRMGRRRLPLLPGRYDLQAGLCRDGDVLVNLTNCVSIEVLEP